MMVFNNFHTLHVAALNNIEVASKKAAEIKQRQKQLPIEAHWYNKEISSRSVKEEVNTATVEAAEQPWSSLSSSMRLR